MNKVKVPIQIFNCSLKVIINSDIFAKKTSFLMLDPHFPLNFDIGK